MSQVCTRRARCGQVFSAASTGWVVGCADPVAGSSVIATPSPAPSGAVSDITKTSPRSLVPAGTAAGPDPAGRSTHASQAFPGGGAGRRTIRYGDPGKCATVLVGLLTRRAHDGERHDEQHPEGERNERGDGSPEKLDKAVAPASLAGNRRVAVTQHDPRAQIARRLDLDRADGRRLVDGIFKLREVVGARGAC